MDKNEAYEIVQKLGKEIMSIEYHECYAILRDSGMISAEADNKLSELHDAGIAYKVDTYRRSK